MSTERSSSAVRNLRSLFENKASENSPDTRGRSPGLLSRRDDNKSPSPLPPPRTSRIRASFVAVEPRFNMSAAAEETTTSPPPDVTQNTASELRRESSKGLRRASFSDNKDGVAAGALRETIITEQTRRDEDSTVGETIPEVAVESAAPTPLVEVDQQLTTAKTDKPAGNPDKPVTGAEEEPAAMKPADPASEEAVSGGKALSSRAEDLRKPEVEDIPQPSPPVTRAAAASGKPLGIATKETNNKPASKSLKSPDSQPKTPLSPASNGTPPKPAAQGAKKAGRASLSAPTAASVARAAAADKATAASKNAAPKPKAREPPKPPADFSRLTAPTAASRAKHEPTTAAPAISKPTTTKPKPAASKPTPRHSLARPESRGSQTRKPAGPVDSSFLDRMTRPTAASSNKFQKPEPAPKQLPHRNKVNGHPKGVKTASKDAVAEPVGDTTAIEEPSISQEEAVETENSVPHTNGHTNGQANTAQEAESTPSAKTADGVPS